MITALILLAGLFGRAPAPVPVPPAPQPPPPPVWASRASEEAINAAYPAAALAAGASGTVNLACDLQPDGALVNCKVNVESLPGYGFGDAALGLAGSYRLSTDYPAGFPPTFGITIQWLHPDYKRAAAAAAAGQYEGIAVVDMKRVGWARRGNGEDTARYYPGRAQRLEQAGSAVTICFITVSGSLSDCQVLREEPEGFEFGAAAVRLLRYFRTRLVDVDGKPVAGKAVKIYLGFIPPAGPPPPPPAAPN